MALSVEWQRGPKPDPEREPDPYPPPPDIIIPLDNKDSCNSYEMMLWKVSFLTKEQTGIGPEYDYERKYTGKNQFRATGGGEKAWADGIDIVNCSLQDAKFVGNPERSPYIIGSEFPHGKVNRAYEQEDELFRRYSKIIGDQSTPANRLDVITNNISSVSYWNQFIIKYNIHARIFNKAIKNEQIICSTSSKFRRNRLVDFDWNIKSSNQFSR